MSHPSTVVPTPQPQTPPPPTEAEVNATLRTSEQTALKTFKRNLHYLFNPTSASTSHQSPTRLRTRTFLRVLHYLGVFLFWRLVRWAKYAAVGAAVAAVSATALGSVASGAAFVVAPPTFLGSLGVGALWGVGRYGFRKAAERTRRGKNGGIREVSGGEGARREVPGPGFLGDTFA